MDGQMANEEEGGRFRLAGRGYKLSPEQEKYIRQVNEKVASGEYRMVPKPCPCGADDDDLLATRDRYGFVFNTVICKKCGTIRANPYFDEEALRNFYSNEFDRIYRSVYKDEQDYYRQRAAHGRRIIRYLRLNGIDTKNRVVYEIGCAGGGLLEVFRNAGCTVKGADYNVGMIQQGQQRGLNLVVGGVECFRDDPPADIVILNHVLEHITDPVGFLRQARDLLKEDGVMYVEVPTIETIRSTYRHNIFNYLQNAHVFCFSSHTLPRVLQEAGYGTRLIDESRALATRDGRKDPEDACADEYGYALAILEAEDKAFYAQRQKADK